MLCAEREGAALRTETQAEIGSTTRNGIRLCWTRQPGKGPTLVFLPGFRSHRHGEKAEHLARLCAERGQAMLRLDYAGHGDSGGDFEAGSIGQWRDDALAVIDDAAPGPLLLVGSSMGGWIALLIACARPGRVAGLIGIAAAPDFTERLILPALTPPERATLDRDGVVRVQSPYGDAVPITRTLIEDGRRHLLLDAAIDLHCPVRLLHGQADPDVPWEWALRLAARLKTPDVRITLIKDGDHRLSRPADLAQLGTMVTALLDDLRALQDGP